MPNRFTPITSTQSTKAALQQINQNFMQLDAEAFTKTVQKGGNNQVMFGKLPNNRYGLLIYDDGGMPRILIGQAPKDGRPGVWITKSGFDVINEID
jgi:hypothetical protein